MRLTTTTAIGVLGLAALLISACSSSNGAKSSGNTSSGSAGTAGQSAAAAATGTWSVNSSACPADATTPLAAGADIKLGNIAALSGPVSAAGQYPQGERIYFNKINAAGGIDGHKIVFDSKDDQYNATQTVPQASSLIEQDKVMAVIAQVGTPTVLAAQPLAEKSCTPQLFVISGDSQFGNPTKHPFTTGGYTLYTLETRAWAQYISQQKPGATVAVSVLDNDAGVTYSTDFSKAAKEFGLKIVTSQKIASTATNADGQVTAMLASNPDFVVIEPPVVTCGQILSGLRQGGFKGGVLGVQYCSTPAVISGIGDAANGYLWATGYLDGTDPSNATNPDVKTFLADLQQYGDGAKNGYNTLDGYKLAKLAVDTITAAAALPGGLTRVNIMNAAWNLHGVKLFGQYCGTANTAGPADPFADECVAVLQHTASGTKEVTTFDDEGKGNG